MLCAFRYVLDGLAHQQTDVVIGALLVGGCCALARGRSLTAGTVFGLAAAIKCTAVLWIVYLVWRGQWKMAAWVVLVAVGVNLLPNLVSTPEGGGLWLQQWYATYLAPMKAGDHYPGLWGADIYYNQSISGFSYRLCVAQATWQDGELQVAERAGAPTAGSMRLLVNGVQLALVLLAVFVVGRPRRRLPEGSRAAVECSLVLLLMLLLSPMSSKPHFCTMLLPAFLLARLAAVEKRRWAGALVAAAILLGLLAMRDVWGFRISASALWYGAVMWSAALLALGCGIAVCGLADAKPQTAR
jgi:hypothetical protein